jgi:hypothetical protein
MLVYQSSTCSKDGTATKALYVSVYWIVLASIHTGERL